MPEPYRIGKLTRTKTDGSKVWSYCMTWANDNAAGRSRVSLDTQDRVEAEAIARKKWAVRTLRSADTVATVVTTYLDSLQGAKDEKRKREAWRAAAPYWGGLAFDVIDEHVSRKYLEWRNRAINTCRNELSLVRTALRWAEKQRIIEKAPHVIVPAMPESETNHLSKVEFKQFLEGCATPHVRLFAILAVTTGARMTALLQAKWEQVDFDRALINLNPKGRQQNSKGRATVPLNDRAMEALREAKAGAMTEYVIEYRGGNLVNIKKGVAAASTRTGIKVHPHMFRHSAAVWMAEDRVPMEEIARFLGHRDIGITSRVYARFNPDYLRKAARSLEW